MARSDSDEPSRLDQDVLDGIEDAIEALKVAYERYFNGVDRIPPAREHDAVKRVIRNMMRMKATSTALRYRSRQLKARLVTYEHYWNRILGQIERGTFKRVLAVSQRRELEAQRRRAEAAAEAEKDGGQRDTDAPRPRPRPRSQSARHQLPDGLDAKHARQLFKDFVQAKKAAGEPITGLTYGKLVDKLAREVPKLQAKHGGEIRFEVATVKGRVRLRARRQKGQKAS